MKMKAAIANQYGTSSVLKIQETEKPVAQGDEVLVKVHASTVNRTDEGILSGRYLLMRFFTGLKKPRSPILGTDFAGTVEAIGPKVSEYTLGDDVFGFRDEGLASHAQYLVISQKGPISHMPGNLDYAPAVSLLEGGHYAYNMMNKIKTKNIKTALVNGATGAIGNAVVQLLNQHGIQISAVCRKKHQELVKKLGADKTFDYQSEDFRETDDRYDLIVDTVIGSSYSSCKHLLTKKGTYVSSELGKNGAHLWRALLSPLSLGRRVIFPVPSQCKKSVEYLKELAMKGKIQSIGDKSFDFDEIAAAYDYVASGQKLGSVVLTINKK